MIIYQITNNLTKDFYIGKTANVKERFYKHKYNASKNKSQAYIYRAMRKHGIENFSFSIVEEVENLDRLNEREIYWIEQLKPQYNMTKGGDGGDTSNSINYRIAIKKVHANKKPSDYATYGMQGKKQSKKFLDSIKISNCCAVSCEGKIFNSVREAEIAYPGIKIRHRLDSDKYPDFFRLRPKTKRK